ncbi:transposable element Tc3 transposase [Trichonephila clavipes]|uniref:Transposable element Tc3 transposase n=1 Tax=Trichonephila clavipes TaxID=2585209 RepID=A0A8X6RP20_TRICX|nr:transposable element Tc3 transposase [Trichonephila clavipes]
MFSDESRFSPSSDSRQVTIWRERGTHFEPRNITERHHFPSRGVMVWAGIMDGYTDLHFFDTGCVTVQRYRDEVLEPYVCLFRGDVGPDFIFMDDHAPCHRAVLIDDFLEMENIQRMSWPANSHDLIPIEHVWDMLGRQIAALSHPPSSVTELKRALQEALNRLSTQLIHHLIASAIETSRNITARAIERDTSGEIYFLEDSRGFQTCQLGRQCRKNGRKNDANLALPPRFRQVLIKSPL